MPTGEETVPDVAQRYDEVRDAIRFGEGHWDWGANATQKHMHWYESGGSMWKEVGGEKWIDGKRVSKQGQVNAALRSDEETEYEAFLDQDVIDGLQVDWRRPMHWAGFLVMGASTRLPRGDAKEGGAGMKGWTVEQVETFVQGLAHEFGEKVNVYAETLKREDVNGETLLGLSEDDLKDLGFSLGHRRKLLACIQRSS